MLYSKALQLGDQTIINYDIRDFLQAVKEVLPNW